MRHCLVYPSSNDINLERFISLPFRAGKLCTIMSLLKVEEIHKGSEAIPNRKDV